MPVVTHCQHPSTRHNTLPVPSLYDLGHAPFEKTGLNPLPMVKLFHSSRKAQVCMSGTSI